MPVRARKKIKRRTPKRATADRLDPQSRTKLLKAAESLFGQKGFDAVTVRDLARDAGVNLSLVSYHFGGKLGVYREVIRESLQNRTQSVDRILGQLRGGQTGSTAGQAPSWEGMTPEAFRRIFQSMIADIGEFALEHRFAIAILMREAEAGFPHIRDEFESLMLGLMARVEGFFEGAQKSGVLRSDFRPHTLMMLVHGAIVHALRCDQLQKEYFGCSFEDPRHRQRFLNEMCEVFLAGVLAPARR